MLRIYSLLAASLAPVSATSNCTSSIIARAKADGINLWAVPFAADSLASIDAIDAQGAPDEPATLKNASKVDVHAHVVPSWYHAMVPFTGQTPTPNWVLPYHLAFMASNIIGHSVLSISSPGSVLFPGSEETSAAVARLFNEHLAAIARKLPHLFSFYAVTPLPYTRAAITETRYALDHLGAAGVGLLSNHEGYYLGNRTFTPLFAKLNTSDGAIFVRPSGPCLHSPTAAFSMPTQVSPSCGRDLHSLTHSTSRLSRRHHWVFL